MQSRWWILLLKLCVSTTLAARGWLTWRWDSPIRGLIWNESWWDSLVEWSTFAAQSDALINRGLAVIGYLLLLGSIVPWLINRPRLGWTAWLLVPLSFILMLDSFGRWIDSSKDLAMAIEHTLQWGCPLLLLLVVKWPADAKCWIRCASAATILTFVGHGLYAVGFHPVPLKFQTMTMKILKCDESQARIFLSAAGYLDFIAAVAILIPAIRTWGLLYMVAWGGLTALARIVANPDLDPWLMETLVRTSHWLIPLLIWLKLRDRSLVDEPKIGNPSGLVCRK